MGVDGDITVDRQRAAVAEEHEALGIDVRNGVIEIKGGESLRAAVEVEDRGLSGVVHHQGRAGVELLSPARRDPDHARVEVGIAAGPVGDDRHVHRQDARAALGDMMVGATADGSQRPGERRVAVVRAEAGIALRARVDGERTRAGQGTERVAIGDFPGRAGVDDDRSRVGDDAGAADDLTGGDDERSGEGVRAREREHARTGLGETTRAADDAAHREVVRDRREVDETVAARKVDRVAVRGGRAREDTGGRTGVTEGRAVADVDRLVDAEAQGAGTGSAGVAEDEDAAVDHRVPRVGVGAGQRDDAGTGGNQAGDRADRREILDRRADRQAARIEVLDDQVTAGRADLEAAGGAGDREGVGAGDEQAADGGAEGEVERGEIERLRSSRIGDLERADGGGGGRLGLARAEGIVDRTDGGAGDRQRQVADGADGDAGTRRGGGGADHHGRAVGDRGDGRVGRDARTGDVHAGDEAGSTARVQREARAGRRGVDREREAHAGIDARDAGAGRDTRAAHTHADDEAGGVGGGDDRRSRGGRGSGDGERRRERDRRRGGGRTAGDGDRRSRDQAGQREGSAGGSGGKPVVVRTVGEDRAAVAVDQFGGASGGGGDLGVRRSGHEQGAGVGGGAESKRAEHELRERRVAGDDGDLAAVLVDGDVTERLAGGEAGATLEREITARDRERSGRHERGQRGAVGEVEDDGAAGDEGRTGVRARDGRIHRERTGTLLGDGEPSIVDGRGQLAAEDRTGVIAADGEGGRRGAGGVQDIAAAGKRADDLAGVVDVEGRARGDGQRRAVRQHVAGLGLERAGVDDRGAAVGVSDREQERSRAVLRDAAARDQRAGLDFDRARAVEDDVRLVGTEAAGERDLARGGGRSDRQLVVEIHQGLDVVRA